MSDRDALLLYDGTCGFCARSVQFVLGHEGARKSLRFAALQSGIGGEVRRRHPELEGVDSVVWYEPAANERDERVLVRSAAVFATLHYLGGIWSVLATIGAVVPRVIRDAVYDFIARHRHKLVRGAPVCVLPSAEQRSRFVDAGEVSEAGTAVPR